MADKRKLQCDIERTLKRVQEGRTSFQDILDRFESSANQTQKEKFEADLKKEIKRLQRFRDQIKTWHTSNDIKDKRPLVEARRLIEQDMERFKVIEKETKTKAYSKEGLLTADAKKDPLQKEKEDLDEWLKQAIYALQTKSEKYEYDLETLTHTGKKKRADRDKAALLEEKRQKLELCAYHIEKLETVMRHLDNERLDCLKVRSLHDPIEYVIECIDDNSMEEYRSLYEDLHLEDLGDSAILTPNTPGVSGFPDYDMTVPPFPPIAAVKSPSVEDVLPAVPTSLPAASTTSSTASSSRERPKHPEEKYPISPVTPSSTSTPVAEKRDRSVKTQPSSGIVNQTAPSVLQFGSSPVVTPRENYAKVAGESKKSKKDQLQDQESDAKTVTPTTTPIKCERKKDDKMCRDESPSPEPSIIAFPISSSLVDSNSTVVDQAPTVASAPAPKSVVAALTAVTAAAPTTAAPLFTASDDVSVANSVAPPDVSIVAGNTILSHHQQQQQQHAAVMAAVAQQANQTQMQQQQNASPFVIVHPRDALAPFRSRQIDKQRGLPLELRSQVHALESAYRRQPLGTDVEKARLTLFKKPANVPAYYPSEPLKGTDTEEYFMKLDAQTLFFLFYFFEGTKIQYLAAKALKRMSWRFHTKHLMWFQRNEEPKQITDEFESGTYIYYDCASMSQRKKEEFIFYYSFLEDKEF